MPASASLSALALGEGDVEGEWRHSQETRFHSRETRNRAFYAFFQTLFFFPSAYYYFSSYLAGVVILKVIYLLGGELR